MKRSQRGASSRRALTSKLVLITAWYPWPTGDVTFVKNEIDALAAEFDDVVIFQYGGPTEQQPVPLPGNVRFGGFLYEHLTRAHQLKTLLLPAIALQTLHVLALEAVSGQLWTRFGKFVAMCLDGVRIANHPALQAEVSDPSARVTVYSFWGMGGAIAIPWLSARVDRIAVRLHSYDLYRDRADYQPFRRAILTAADVVLVISDHGLSYVKRTYPWFDERVNAVTSRLGTQDHGVRPARLVTERSFVVVSCSNIIPLKRVGLILDALEHVTARPLKWVHFGGGELEPAIRAKALQMENPDLKVELRGSVPHEEIMEFYRTNHVSVFVNASTVEGVPVSIMEAMSFDIPIVATEAGATSELVNNELASGLLVPVDVSAEELALAIDRAIAAPSTFRARQAWKRMSDAQVTARVAASLVAGTSQPSAGR